MPLAGRRRARNLPGLSSVTSVPLCFNSGGDVKTRRHGGHGEEQGLTEVASSIPFIVRLAQHLPLDKSRRPRPLVLLTRITRAPKIAASPLQRLATCVRYRGNRQPPCKETNDDHADS